ncbi:cysteine hydrolase family protein [Entomohabitans teleogrylli]|uniref:cysteine hydrolase family protein n=1 Tax=Entomohabitans teleogrylli TaxID=1384589 RepID=UPI00073D38F0|nr:isochorismatase family cysteine hydrolase [Entomohabitans teleogrylli]
MKTVNAQPFNYAFDPETTALIVIDMQRDFVEPDGFGAVLGNDVSLVRKAIAPCSRLLRQAREAGLFILHTREGHRADLSNCPPAKLTRGGKTFIGEPGAMGRILIQGEAGHDIIPELYPQPGEPVIDKPGKGAFYATDLHLILQARGIRSLIICGVTTEVCVQTTAREANDRGYEVLIPEDCCASYFPEFHRAALEMIKAQGAIVGWVSNADAVIQALR